MGPTGDIDTIEGLDNLKEALLRRLLTTPGSMIHHPTYGVGIKNYQNGINSMANQRRLAYAIIEQFREDPRVEAVTGISVEYKDRTPDLIEIKVGVKVVGYGETTFGFIPFGDV